jgi:outer membrane receptor protein involved in Fe transport
MGSSGVSLSFALNPFPPVRSVLPAFRVVLSLLGVALAASVAIGQAAAPRRFDLREGPAQETLKAFAAQSGREIVFAPQFVASTTTRPVRGDLAPAAALATMLEDTGLVFSEDARTGAFAVRRREVERRPADPAAAEAPARKAPPVVAGPGPASSGTVALQPVEVTGSRLRQTDIEGPSPVLTFDQEFLQLSGFGTTEEFLRILPQNFTGASAGRSGVPNDENPLQFARNAGQSGVGLRGLGSNSTLVLINGRRAPLSGRGNNATTPPQGFFDINTIPMGMIERIEVLTDGASAIYGTDAIGGVVNIILKKAFNETELRVRFGGTWHGGGFERGATLTHGVSRGPWKITTVLDVFQREPLWASQRWFSKSGDLRPRGGDDFRSTIGYPMTLFALPGQTLRGLTNPDGTPATQAVVPAGQDGRSLTVGSFAATAGQRAFYNTADLYSIISPTDRRGVSLHADYALHPRITLFSELSYTRVYTDTKANPVPTNNPNGLATLPRIPANHPLNPFKQDLGIAIAHEELGPRNLLASTNSLRAVGGARVVLPRNWEADASVMYYGQRLKALNGGLPDNAAMIAALNQTDPNRVLNLFGDYRFKGPTNQPGVYESVVRITEENARSDVYMAETLARGPVWTAPGGEVRVAVGGEWNQQDRIRTTNVPTTLLPARSREVRNQYAAYAEAAIPVFGRANARPLLHRLDLQIAARYEDIEDAGQTTNPKYAVRWQPVPPVLLRASYGTGYRAPALTELERPEANQNQTLFDRRRNNERYLMLVTSGSDPNLAPETSETFNYGAVINIPKVAGLSVGVDYYRKEIENLSTNILPQTLLDFERSFSSRILRLPATPAEQAAGTPGRVSQIDARFVNFGLVVTEGFDYSVNYQFSTETLGRFHLRAAATYLASYKIAFNPGDPLVERKGSFGFPQDFKGNVMAIWNRGPLGGSIAVYHQEGFDRNGRPVDAFTTVDVTAAYEWTRRRLRLQAGIGNVFDLAPPFANTVWGYDGGFHSAKMRTYNASVSYRF